MTICFDKDTVLLIAHYSSEELHELEVLAGVPLEIDSYYESQIRGCSDIYLGKLLFSRGIPTEWFSVIE